MNELKSKISKELWNDPEYRAKTIECMKKSFTLELREKQRQRMKVL